MFCSKPVNEERSDHAIIQTKVTKVNGLSVNHRSFPLHRIAMAEPRTFLFSKTVVKRMDRMNRLVNH